MNGNDVASEERKPEGKEACATGGNEAKMRVDYNDKFTVHSTGSLSSLFLFVLFLLSTDFH